MDWHQRIVACNVIIHLLFDGVPKLILRNKYPKIDFRRKVVITSSQTIPLGCDFVTKSMIFIEFRKFSQPQDLVVAASLGFCLIPAMLLQSTLSIAALRFCLQIYKG